MRGVAELRVRDGPRTEAERGGVRGVTRLRAEELVDSGISVVDDIGRVDRVEEHLFIGAHEREPMHVGLGHPECRSEQSGDLFGRAHRVGCVDCVVSMVQGERGQARRERESQNETRRVRIDCVGIRVDVDHDRCDERMLARARVATEEVAQEWAAFGERGMFASDDRS